MNKREAVSLTNTIRSNLKDLDECLTDFIEQNGWTPMGYRSFTEWWDGEIGQLRLAGYMKTYVISLMILERDYDDSITMAAIAEKLGISVSTVYRMSAGQQANVLGRGYNITGDQVDKWAAMLDHDTAERIKAWAKLNGMTKADTVRTALAEFADRRKLA